MPKLARAQRHEQAAQVLATPSRTASAEVGTHLELAYRYRVGLGLVDGVSEELRNRAGSTLIAAGQQALTRSDLVRAGHLLEAAAGLFSPGEAGWSAATRQLGEVRLLAGRGADGRILLQAVLDQGGEPLDQAHAQLSLASAGPVAGSAATARATLPVFERAGDMLGQARARIRIAQEQQMLGQHAAATDLLFTGLAHAVRAEAEAERALALGAVGISLWRGPEPVPSAIERCRALLAEHAGPRPVARLTLSCPMAVLLALDEQWDEAHALLADARRIAAGLEFADAAIGLSLFEAAVEGLAGRPAAGVTLLEEAWTAARQLDAGSLASAIEREIVRLLIDSGRYAEAAERLAAVHDVADLLRSDIADLDGMRGRVAAAQGRTAEALSHIAGALSAAALTDSPIVQGVAALDQAAVMSALGRRGQAAEAAEAARRLFEAKGHRPAGRAAARLRSLVADGGHNPAKESPHG
jgi:tetratricopeptide (TPR) repeat protein